MTSKFPSASKSAVATSLQRSESSEIIAQKLGIITGPEAPSETEPRDISRDAALERRRNEAHLNARLS